MVIKSLEVVFNPEESKHAVLPKGHKFSTDSPIVVLTGENATGKSMLLRMMQTSLGYNKFFEENNYSKVKDELELDKLNDWSAGSEELYQHFPELKGIEALCPFNVEPFFRFFSQRNPELGIDLEKDTTLREYVQKLNNGELRERNTLTMSYQKHKKVKDSVEMMVNDATDENIWGYLKPTMTTPHLYTAVYAPAKGIAQSNAKISSQKQQAHFEFEIRCAEKWVSSGQDLMRSTERFWEMIPKFFEEYKVQDVANDAMDNMGWLMAGKDPEKDIPEDERADAKLVVLMDEPTVFLSYGNTYKFRDQVMEACEKYGDKIQFFMATNDAVMIEKFPNAKYLDFNSHPIAFKDKITPW